MKMFSNAIAVGAALFLCAGFTLADEKGLNK
jgi:hypothetical protein